MRVFISWSGETAREVADALHAWLRLVVQACRPWVSDQDIDAGAFWDDEVKSSLAEARFGIVCVTAENLRAPWLNYEAGALAERLSGFVCPYLFGVKKNELAAAPLSRLQAQQSDRDGTFNLVTAVNKRLGTDAIPDTTLLESFETFWPRLQERLGRISLSPTPRREPTEKLDELLSLVQSQTQLLMKLSGAALASGHANTPPGLVENRLQVLLHEHLSSMPEYQGWSVKVTRFGTALQARFASSDGTQVIDRKIRQQDATDPVEALASLFLTARERGG